MASLSLEGKGVAPQKEIIRDGTVYTITPTMPSIVEKPCNQGKCESDDWIAILEQPYIY